MFMTISHVLCNNGRRTNLESGLFYMHYMHFWKSHNSPKINTTCEVRHLANSYSLDHFYASMMLWDSTTHLATEHRILFWQFHTHFWKVHIIYNNIGRIMYMSFALKKIMKLSWRISAHIIYFKIVKIGSLNTFILLFQQVNCDKNCHFSMQLSFIIFRHNRIVVHELALYGILSP